jgi:hypothetical protein
VKFCFSRVGTPFASALLALEKASALLQMHSATGGFLLLPAVRTPRKNEAGMAKTSTARRKDAKFPDRRSG